MIFAGGLQQLISHNFGMDCISTTSSFSSGSTAAAGAVVRLSSYRISERTDGRRNEPTNGNDYAVPDIHRAPLDTALPVARHHDQIDSYKFYTQNGWFIDGMGLLQTDGKMTVSLNTDTLYYDSQPLRGIKRLEVFSSFTP